MRRLLAATALASLTFSGCAQADPVDKAEVENIVRAYLLENPEILIEMSEALREKERADEERLLAEVLKDLDDRIKTDPRDITIGPDDAKVTVVEFFDYNCPPCKASTKWTRNLIDEHGDDVRVIFKEIPILDRGAENGSSRQAARAALAAAKQGKYTTMHFSLMNERSLTPERIEAIAEAAGLDMDQFREDVADPALDVHLNQNLQLAREIPTMATPFFIINDEVVRGADIERLETTLEAALGS